MLNYSINKIYYNSMVKDYIYRIIDSAIDRKLHSSGALMIVVYINCFHCVLNNPY